MANLEISEIVAVLERTPAILGTLFRDLPAGWLERHEGEGTFDARDILGHLIHGEKTDWIPRIKMILESGAARPFVPFDRRGHDDAKEAALGPLLVEFESLRKANLVFLDGLHLTRAQLALEGRHPELGGVTLGQLLATWAVHDLNHIAQAVRVMSQRYSEAVGPWKPYLGILNR